jgi:hexosaminidase
VKDLVEYGRLRGVRVMIEFDMPGHAGSWCAGYPDICPSKICTQPLDPSNDLTFTLIDSLLGECTGRSSGAGLFPYDFLHLGGDEVDYLCWETTPHISDWQEANGLNGSEGTYEYFVNKAAEIARNQSRTPVQWVEVFEHFGDKLDHNTVVHVWKAKSTMDAVLQAGYRSLLSDSDLWYLDWLEVTWDQMYTNEPTEGLSDGSDPELILGGKKSLLSLLSS